MIASLSYNVMMDRVWNISARQLDDIRSLPSVRKYVGLFRVRTFISECSETLEAKAAQRSFLSNDTECRAVVMDKLLPIIGSALACFGGAIFGLHAILNSFSFGLPPLHDAPRSSVCS